MSTATASLQIHFTESYLALDGEWAVCVPNILNTESATKWRFSGDLLPKHMAVVRLQPPIHGRSLRRTSIASRRSITPREVSCRDRQFLLSFHFYHFNLHCHLSLFSSCVCLLDVLFISVRYWNPFVEEAEEACSQCISFEPDISSICLDGL